MKTLFGWFLFGLVLLVGGCAKHQSESATMSALPPVDILGDYSCEPPIFYGDDPSLEAWIGASTSIIVGTVDRVVLVDEPVLVEQWDPVMEDSYIEVGDVTDCHPEMPISFLADIYLKRVETLHGEEMPGGIKVRVLWSQWDLSPRSSGDGVEWLDQLNFPNVVKGVFAPGSRIGGAVIHHEAVDLLSFDFRLFEVRNNVVHLQRYSAENERELDLGVEDNECPLLNWRSMLLPKSYDQMPWKQFENAVRNVNVEASDLRQYNESVERYRAYLQSEALRENGGYSRRQYMPSCRGSFRPVSEEDPEGDRDPG